MYWIEFSDIFLFKMFCQIPLRVPFLDHHNLCWFLFVLMYIVSQTPFLLVCGDHHWLNGFKECLEFVITNVHGHNHKNMFCWCFLILCHIVICMMVCVDQETLTKWIYCKVFP
eukprot:789049_1